MSPKQLAAPTTDRTPDTTPEPRARRIMTYVYPVGHPELARPLF